MGKKRSSSSSRWLREHENDEYVIRSREDGYRSRAVYKLQEIDERDHLFSAGQRIVDLGAAPGSWSQWLARKYGSHVHIIALDILPMDEIKHVDFLLGDFREQSVLTELEQKLEGKNLDLVISDMAPNLSGIDVADQAASLLLTELALDFACDWLKPGGDFVVKVFHGIGFDDFLKTVRSKFGKVFIRKPKASRGRSREQYLVARNYLG